MTDTRLSDAKLRAELATLPDWRVEQGRLVTQLTFASFRQAFGFMAELALVSEQLNHHPDWENVYNRVSIRLSTHEAGGITSLDVAWARQAQLTSQRYLSGHSSPA